MKKTIDTANEDAFIREVNEDMKNEQMKALWKKYGVLIVICVAVLLTIVVSWEAIKAKKIQGSEALVEEYTYAISLQNQGRYEESLAVLNKIIDTKAEVYEDAAKVQISNIYFEQGKFSEAIAILEEVAKDKNVTKQFRDMSIIKLAGYKLDTAPRDEIVGLLTPVANEAGSWSNIAKEMLAMLYIREGDFAKAKGMYENILNSPEADEELRIRVKDMLATINAA